MTESVVSALLEEIERVTAKRERWIQYSKEAGPGANFSFAIMAMKEAIDAGKKAILEDDAVAAIAALHSLQGYNSDD